jgi:hypothetical protein
VREGVIAARHARAYRRAMSVLDTQVAYRGPATTAEGVERVIADERALHREQVSTLERLRARNGDLQTALTQELNQLDGLTQSIDAEQTPSFWDGLRSVFSFLPGVEARQTPQSVQLVLREQFAHSQTRLQEAAAFADRLEQAEADLFDEIDRLNTRIIEAATNEQTAAEHLLAVEAHRGTLEGRLHAAEGVEARTIQAELDSVRRVMAEHSLKLRLFATAEERLARLKTHSARLAETIAHLRSDILRYVMAAGEQLDLVSGQINAVGAAAIT